MGVTPVMTQVKPYKDEDSSKKEQVARMFDSISGRYDFLNHFLSFGIDKGWRRRLLREARSNSPQKILDIATGTGDLAIALKKTGAREIVGLDISNGMLDVGRKKVTKAGLDATVRLEYGDSEQIGYESESFDLVTAAFGVRNFEHLQQGLSEMARVTKKGGRLMILEFSQPTKSPFKQLYRFYSKHILPRVGRMVSKDSSAYDYLPESVDAFPYGDDFLKRLDDLNLKNLRCIPLTFGVSSLYIAEK
jgi:demethylmenaquinone methyltransferase/2-methoxy-6-polyprenyl-1,4-benzoquinol methylase